MSKRFVTIVSDQKGGFSFHSSWKKACENYEWEYTKSIPSFKDGHKISKAPMDVTIPCLELVEFIHRKDIVQQPSRDESEGTYEYEFYGYGKGYYIKCEYEKHWQEGEAGGSGPYGYNNGDCEWIPGGHYDTIEDVIEVCLLDEDSTPIKIDDWTKEQILNIAETTDY